jgi:hypothetical protein
LAGIAAVLLGALLVFLVFPKFQKERELLAAYHKDDSGEAEKEGDTNLPGASNF